MKKKLLFAGFVLAVLFIAFGCNNTGTPEPIDDRPGTTDTFYICDPRDNTIKKVLVTRIDDEQFIQDADTLAPVSMCPN
jgi:hypothetical protein